jgi:hypothetical protein
MRVAWKEGMREGRKEIFISIGCVFNVFTLDSSSSPKFASETPLLKSALELPEDNPILLYMVITSAYMVIMTLFDASIVDESLAALIELQSLVAWLYIW